MSDLPQRIRRLRKIWRMTQSEMAKKLGVRVATVSDWETGKATPSTATLSMIADLSRMNRETVYAILTDPDTPMPSLERAIDYGLSSESQRITGSLGNLG